MRNGWRPYADFSSANIEHLKLPLRRTEWVSANDTSWQQTVRASYPFDGSFLEQPHARYEPGQRAQRTWLRQVTRPAVPSGIHEKEWADVGVPAYREGDNLRTYIPAFVDNAGNHLGFAREPGDTTRARLYRDGQLVAEEADAIGEFPARAEPSSYRLVLDVTRSAPWWTLSTRTHTEWTFRSERPADGERALLPLVQVDYDIDLDMLNRARGTRAFNVDLYAGHQPGVGGPDIAGMKAWVSYDDGDSWRPVRNLRNQQDGHYRALVKHPRVGGSGGHVSLRVRVRDETGNVLEQTVIRAYGLK